MKIKYTDLYGSICVRIPEIRDFMGNFIRNQWKEVPDDVGKYLKEQSPYFMDESDCIFIPDKFAKMKKIGIFRSSALGDIIQLIPIVRELRKRYSFEIHLLTQSMYIEYFQKLNIYDSVLNQGNIKREDFDKIIYLNGVLENDHSMTNEENSMHRVKIYEKFFSLDITDYEWCVELDKSVLCEVEKILC